ncbi:MAG: hypothetical protein ACXVFU_10830 [Nocardioidaceae bacterium]
MRWEERLLAVFDDLEQQAEGLALAERDAAVAELAAAEYAHVDLASRLHGSVGLPLTLDVTGHGAVAGVLARAGADWLLVEDPAGRGEWLVRLAAVTEVRGASPAARSVEARGPGARLGLGSALRGLAEERAEVRLARLDGSRLAGYVGRVGADFLELREPRPDRAQAEGARLVPFAALAVLARSPG